jgi:hypothetical protein
MEIGSAAWHPISGHDEIMSDQSYNPGYITCNTLVKLELNINMLMNQSGKDIMVDTSLKTQIYTIV